MLSAASSYVIKDTSAHSRASRRVYESNIDFLDNLEPLVEGISIEDYDIDSSASTLLANLKKSSYSNNDIYLPKEDFNSLIPEAKVL